MSHVVVESAPQAAGYDEVLGRSFRDSYLDAGDVWSDEPAMGAAVSKLIDVLAPDSHVLDVGAGRGRDTLALLAAGHRVDAVDLVATSDWPPIRRQWPGRVAFIEGGFMAASLGGPYDGLLDNGCLHHQHPDTWPAYLQRLRALARPGATLVVSFFTPAGDERAGALWMQHDGRLTRDFSHAEAHALLRGNGWHVESSTVVPRASSSHHYLVVSARSRGH